VARVRIASPASADSVDILLHLTHEAGVRVAEQYAAGFDELFQLLETHPQGGPLRPALGANVRIGIVSPYVVIYDYSDAADLVTVLRIVHGRREINRRLLGARSASS
jgi:toxin ParE1/3/4